MKIRNQRRRAFLLRALRITAAIALVWTTLEAILVRQALLTGNISPDFDLSSQNIFIASIHWNNENILRSQWNAAILKVATSIGKGNVYVSILESGSWDDSKGALRELDRDLNEAGIRRRIVLEETTHADLLAQRPDDEEPGWIRLGNGSMQLRRIPYLGELRNRALEPLYELLEGGERFDKVLFPNDVAFETTDIQTLLATNNGHYAAACSLDFSKPPNFYDTFALRDIEGHAALMSNWPYFRASESRQAIKRSQPVPVKSCWNGIVAMDAGPFYDSAKRLAFRGVPDTLAHAHLEGSECCLIHADNSLSASRGVFLNPNVRVGYSGPAYSNVHPANGGPWVSTWAVVRGSWENRIRRWMSTDWLERAEVRRRVGKWKGGGNGREENGETCLINEQQVLVWNGWAHV